MLRTVYLSIVFLVLWAPIAHALSLKTQWGSTETANYRTSGIFAVWWDKKWNHFDDAGLILEELNDLRQTCVNDYGMMDPPNVRRGSYVNIYIHHPKQDLYPDSFGNAVGTDRWGNPYMMLPYGMHNRRTNLSHEGFHLFQYDSKKFPYSGDSGWFVEATANWIKADRYPEDRWSYVGASALLHHPQLPMWHSGFFNLEPGEEHNWGRGMHQYGMNTFLNYLTNFHGVDGAVIAGSFYDEGGPSLPQEALFEYLGGNNMRRYWLDFTSQLAGDYGFLSQSQIDTAEGEWQRLMADKNDDQQFVKIFEGIDTFGQWVTPNSAEVTRGWSFNTYKIKAQGEAAYKIHFDGNQAGDQGTPSVFSARVKIKSGNSTRYQDLKINNSHDGELNIYLGEEQADVYLVVASMPNLFTGNERFSYRIKIDRQLAPSTLRESLECLSKYAHKNICDWHHWSEIYQTCKTSRFPALDDDDFLLNKVRGGACTWKNWSSLYQEIRQRQ